MAKSRYKPNAPRRGVKRISKLLRPYGGPLLPNGQLAAEKVHQVNKQREDEETQADS